MSFRNLTDAAGKTMRVLDVGGYLTSVGITGYRAEQLGSIFHNIPNFKCREDDVMLMSYPKCGSNWLHDILTMLLTKNLEKSKGGKLMTMLDFWPAVKLELLPAPRVINTHMKFRYLPKELTEKQIKTILIVRNPKDMLVSYFNHIRGLRAYGYDGEWNDWFKLYMQGEMEYGMYTEYLKEMEKAVADGIGFPFHIIYYEDLKLNGLREVTKLANFLGVDADDELCRRIVDKCSFESVVKAGRNSDEKIKRRVFNEGFNFYRKGQVGDWQNWFTEAQNEQFNKYWEREMANSMFKFTYKPDTKHRSLL